MSASRPNEASTTGSVAACAARETPRLSLSQRGSRPRARRSSRSVSGVAQAMSPAVASVESWNPASPTSAGSARSSRKAAQPSAAAARPRPTGLAREEHDAGHARRPAAPTAMPRRTRCTTTIATAVTIARRRRPSRPAMAPTAAATIAMFQPEIATTWLTPAVVKSAATSRSTRSRRPMRMPAASPASGSGRTRVSVSPASRRQPSRSVPGSTGRSSTSMRPRVERAPRTEPLEVAAVGAVRARPGASLDDDAITGLDRRVARQRGGEPERRSSRRRRSGASRPGGPRAATRRSRRPSSTARDPPANPSQRRPAAGPTPARSAIDSGPDRQRKSPTRRPSRQPEARSGAGAPAAAEHHGQELGGPRPPTASAATAAPTASQPVRGTSAHRDELAQLLERLLAEDAARPQLVDGRERRFLARGDDLLGRRRPDARAAPRARPGWPGSGRRARCRPSPARPRRRRGGAGARPGIVARRHPDLITVAQRRREVELRLGPGRVDPRAVSASGRDRGRRRATRAGGGTRRAAGPHRPPRRRGRLRRSAARAGRPSGSAAPDSAASGSAEPPSTITGAVRSVRERQDEGQHRAGDRRPDRSRRPSGPSASAAAGS